MAVNDFLIFNIQLFAEERTEPATPRKRRKAREEGQAAKSVDLIASASVLVGIIGLFFLGGFIFYTLKDFFVFEFSHISDEVNLTGQWIFRAGAQSVIVFLKTWLPIGCLSALAVLGISFAQVGFFVTSKPLVPKWDRLNPASGLKKVLSLRSLVELIKGLLKAAVLSWVLYAGLKGSMEKLLLTMQMPLISGLGVLLKMIFDLSIKLAISLFVIALFDYIYQRWEFEKSIRMSRQEIKEEYKQLEGDPQLKSKIRQRQRELARRRMMSEVKKADVVITNPTRVAIALQYDSKLMDAPVVIAKGLGIIAGKIREEAKKHNVPIIERPPLAWALYNNVEIGEKIPEELYKAVAEILVFVYKLKHKRSLTYSVGGRYEHS